MNADINSIHCRALALVMNADSALAAGCEFFNTL